MKLHPRLTKGKSEGRGDAAHIKQKYVYKVASRVCRGKTAIFYLNHSWRERPLQITLSVRPSVG